LVARSKRILYFANVETVTYLHLPAECSLPPLLVKPFKAVVIVEDNVSDRWRAAVSDWLVSNGCLYMVAWGNECSLWDDSVDLANLAAFDYEDVPDDDFVMTTWHEKEPLSEALWFAAHVAIHPTMDLNHTLILHIVKESRALEMLDAFQLANGADLLNIV
jgi:hypothetical protein